MTFTGSGAANETEEGRVDSWSQSDVVKRSGSAWKGGDTVVLSTPARPSGKREIELDTSPE